MYGLFIGMDQKTAERLQTLAEALDLSVVECVARAVALLDFAENERSKGKVIAFVDEGIVPNTLDVKNP
jgi:predicted transcriptional regulator